MRAKLHGIGWQTELNGIGLQTEPYGAGMRTRMRGIRHENVVVPHRYANGTAHVRMRTPLRGTGIARVGASGTGTAGTRSSSLVSSDPPK